MGSRREHFTAVEIADREQESVMRAYLQRWKWEVGRFFDGVGPDSNASEFARIAPDHPIFEITMA
jgi:hypothetical protein